MRYFFAVIFFSLFLGTAFAAGEDTNATSQECSGNWVLSKPAGWVIQNDSGKLLPITGGTAVFGCDKKPIELENDLAGVSVRVECSPSAVPGGLPDIDSVFIVCE